MRFFRSEPPETRIDPEGIRDDIVRATSAAPRRELKELAAAAPQLQYLSHSLSEQEPVLAVASCYLSQRGMDSGILALTNQRLVAVLGEHQRKRTVGNTVHAFRFEEINELSFNPSGVRGVPTCFAFIDWGASGARMTLSVGQDQEWALRLLNLAREELNRSKLR
jgi:hypothetical protein